MQTPRLSHYLKNRVGTRNPYLNKTFHPPLLAQVNLPDLKKHS